MFLILCVCVLVVVGCVDVPPTHVLKDANWLSAVRYRELKSCKRRIINSVSCWSSEMLSLKWVNQAELSLEAAREKWDIMWPCAFIKCRVIWIREDVSNMQNNQTHAQLQPRAPNIWVMMLVPKENCQGTSNIGPVQQDLWFHLYACNILYIYCGDQNWKQTYNFLTFWGHCSILLYVITGVKEQFTY